MLGGLDFDRGSLDPARKGGLAAPLSGPIATLSDAVGGAYRASAAFERQRLRLTLLNQDNRISGKHDSKGAGIAFRAEV